MTLLPPVQARRAARLKAALGEFNNIAEMARVIDTPRPHLSALIHGTKGCGNELAAKIEQRLNKPAGWLGVCQRPPNERRSGDPRCLH